MNKVHSNMQLNEKLDYITEAKTLEEQVARAKEVARVDVTFAELMRMAARVEEKISGLPEGMPDTYKPDTSIPDGMGLSSVRLEFRRIKNFLPNGSMQKVAAHKRELSWIQMLEGMHWKESNILVHIKDQTLFVLYPNLIDVFKELGMKISIDTTLEKKKKAKK